MTVGDEVRLEERRHILRELGYGVWQVGDELHGRGPVTPEMWVPGTEHLRTSVLATWADTTAGLLATLVMGPRVPVTLELDVHLYDPAPGDGEVLSFGRTVKVGRSVFVAEVGFTTGDGRPLAVAGASFMVSPNPDVRLPPRISIDLPPSRDLLTVPLAERAGCVRQEPGTAVLPRTEDGLNASNTVNGGLIALAAEEAALSLTPDTTLASLGLRYLQPARIGPVVATAKVRHGLGLVELRDTGNDNRLTTTATTRTFDR